MTRSLFQSAEHADDQLSITLHYPPAIFYALVHNDVPIVGDLQVENLTDAAIGPLTVSVTVLGPDGELTGEWSRRVPSLDARDETWFDDFRELHSEVATLRSAEEAFPVSYQVAVRQDNGRELRLTAGSRVLANNEWLNSPSVYESIAAFVQPNAPGVDQVLRSAARLLERDTGSGSMQGYQAGKKRVAHIAAAIYEALRELAITYVALPASFEDTGQKVRTTAAVLRERLGNCIDLSVTYAACLEAAGLHPLIWLVDGHAFAGFLLQDDRLSEVVSLEPNNMINVVESGRAAPVELTGIGPGKDSATFDRALQAGMVQIRGGATLLGMVDIHHAHKSGIQAMPSGSVSESEPVDVEPRPQQHRITDLPENLLRSGVFDDDENLAVEAVEDNAPARFHSWRKSLLDLSLRNPLLKLPKRGKGLDLCVPGGALAELDDMIHRGDAIRVVSQDVVNGVDRLKHVHRAQDLDPEVLTNELTSYRRVFGEVTEKSYVAKMRGLQREARTLEQETGSNYLYLTLGTLVHPGPSGDAHAPLFVLPVRIEGGTGHKPYTISIDGDELAAPNWCLVQWLRVKHGVRIPELENPITDDSGIDIVRSFRAISGALVEHNLGNYRVDERASLRILQFSTFQMWRDLTQHWGTFLTNPVVRHLVERPGQQFVDPVGDEHNVTIDEANLQLPIPADGSQLRAIAMAEQGRSFVLEGPPGTGKSQTITNLIAHAIRAGKTVLFVAEKQAALDVVKRRLSQVGLADFCLDLHGRKQSARAIQRQLKDAQEHQAPEQDPEWKALQSKYRARIAALQRHPEQVHGSNAAGHSLWSAYQEVLVYGEGQTADIPASFFGLPEETRVQVEEAATALPAAATSAALRHGHPWSLSSRRSVADLDAEQVAMAAEELERVRSVFHRLPGRLADRIAELRVPITIAESFACANIAGAGRLPSQEHTVATRHPGWASHFEMATAAVADFRQRHDAALGTFQHELFVHPDFDTLAEQATAAGKGLFGRKKRRIALLEKLRPFLCDGAQVDESTVLTAFAEVRAARDEAPTVTGQVRQVPGLPLSSYWWPTSPDALEQLNTARQELDTSRELLDQMPSLWQEFRALSTALPVSDLRSFSAAWTYWMQLLEVSFDTFDLWCGESRWVDAWDRDGARWADDLRTYGLMPLQRWAAVLSNTDVFADAGLAQFRDVVLVGAFDNDDLEVAFQRGVARAALQERLRAQELEYFNGREHDQQVETYLQHGSDLRKKLPARLRASVTERRPLGYTSRRSDAGEVIRRLSSRKDRLSFREALRQYPEAVTLLTPCFLMSPASVANFLEPGAVTFDLVVFDEASQIRVAQAIGAMGRARSAVIVGDSKQMPPTSVMQAGHGDAEGDDEEDKSVVEDLDSILAEAVESGLPQEWLSWHYRSTDESLIAFSNNRYYDDKLATLPAPGIDPTTGISWRRVDGQFDHGTRASHTNRIEAEAIVAEITRLLHDPTTSQRSIGVVTFNAPQRDLLLNLVEESTDEAIQQAILRQDGEELFVKNLENVQGDERDVVLFSLAYSKKSDNGELPLNFGPLKDAGGERRLNVAITRARKQVILFSSFEPKDIDLRRTNATGTKHLRAYLEVAAHGGRPTAVQTANQDAHSDRVVEEIAAALRARGYEVKARHGMSHFTIDLVVRAPGCDDWQVALLLDGPEWRKRPSVADRDAAPSLLETVMGWHRMVRVWLPSWLNEREVVLQRIDEAVQSAPVPAAAADTQVLDVIRHDIDGAGVESADMAAGDETGNGPALEPETERQWADDVDAPAVTGVLRASPAPVRRLAAPVDAEHVESDIARTGVAAFVPYRPEPLATQDGFKRLPADREVRELLAETFLAVTNFEGPIEEERLARLVGQCFGFGRVSRNWREEALRYVPTDLIRRKSRFGTFYWPEHLDPETWTGFRRNQHSDDRKFAEIAPEEIVNAMRAAIDSGDADTEERLERAAMDRLGYTRKTANIESILGAALDFGKATGRIPSGYGDDFPSDVVSDDDSFSDAMVLGGTPNEGIQTAERAAAGSAHVSRVEYSGNALDQVNAWLAELDQRSRQILASRYFAEEPLSLEELGGSYGVSRERIRQIEGVAKRHVLSRLEASASVGGLLEQLRRRIQPVAALTRLIDDQPLIAEPVHLVDAPLWLLLDKFDDFFEVVDGWAVAPSVNAAAERTALLLTDLANPHGAVALSELGPVVDEFGMGVDELRAWLEWCGYQLVNDFVLTRAGSFVDRAAAVLSMTGNPLTVDEINAKLGSNLNPRGLGDRLSQDSRFTRVDKGTWALDDWQQDEYTTIRGEIGKIIDVAGGIALSELISQIRARFRSISESSIRAYAAQHPFETRNGRVRRSSTTKAPRKSPEQTGRLFRRGDSWVLRIRVNTDHLRGSGFPIPVALAATLGVEQGGEVEFHSHFGLRSLRWTGLQPQFSSIRQFLEFHEVNAGALVFLQFTDDGAFHILVPSLPLPDDPPLDRALWLVGHWDARPGSAEGLLRSAVRLPEHADRPQLLTAYRSRGDEDITDALERAWLSG